MHVSLLRSEVPGYASLPTSPLASQLNRRVTGKAANSLGAQEAMQLKNYTKRAVFFFFFFLIENKKKVLKHHQIQMEKIPKLPHSTLYSKEITF